MTERKYAATELPPGKESDLEYFGAVAAWYTPDFLMQASRTSQSAERLSGAEDGGIKSDEKSSVAGRYLATRGLLAAPEQIERAIQDLRDCISVCGGKHAQAKRDAMLQAWIEIEPGLNDRELCELRDSFLNSMFPQIEAPAPSRGRGAQGGGHSECP